MVPEKIMLHFQDQAARYASRYQTLIDTYDADCNQLRRGQTFTESMKKAEQQNKQIRELTEQVEDLKKKRDALHVELNTVEMKNITMKEQIKRMEKQKEEDDKSHAE